jgi:uncharacterized protein (TIGR02118 family)
MDRTSRIKIEGESLIKTIGLMPRRPDVSRAAFRDHYENRHAPLALKHFPFVKYVRNHVVESLPDPVGFDCLSEFWVEDVALIHALMGSDIGEMMREDERRFADQPRIAPAVADEILLFGPARGVDDGVVRKEALLLSRAAESPDMDLVVLIAGWAGLLASAADGAIARLTLDALTPFEGRYFPDFQAVLQAWIVGEADGLVHAVAPQGLEIAAWLRLEAIETRLS